MASLYRKTYTKPLPEGAETFTRKVRPHKGRPREGEGHVVKGFAEWIDGHGRPRTAELSPDGQGIIIESPIWYARYRDADGVGQRKSTGCRDEQSAEQFLARLLSQAEKIRSGVLSPEEADTARHAGKALSDHFTDYLDFLKAKTVRGRKVSAHHRRNVEIQLNRVAADCSFRRIGDISRQRMVRWMNAQTDTGDMAPRTVNTHRAALMAFCNWAVANQRLVSNPLEGLSKADESETRRRRRALSPEELSVLMEAARTRPLHDAMTIRRGERKGQQAAELGDVERDRLIRLGRERSLVIETLAYTGLRKSELASLTIADLYLDGDHAYAELSGKNAKNARGAKIPLRKELAGHLRDFLEDKLSEYRRRTLAEGRTEYAAALPDNMPLFNIPRDLIRTFDRDLVAAGLAREVKDPGTGKKRIVKTDAQGRAIDVHSLRHTFATMLSKAGVSPRMAQELLRHSDIRLTMNTYTHVQLIDTAAAVEMLPSITGPKTDQNHQRQTGTHGGVCGAEIGAVTGAERQEFRGSPRQAMASHPDRSTKADKRKPPVNRGQSKPLSSSDKGFQEAGEGSRTLNIQLGRLTL